jgi:hypothetical protein
MVRFRSPDPTLTSQVIRSLFVNPANDSVVLVSVYRADQFSSLVRSARAHARRARVRALSVRRIRLWSSGRRVRDFSSAAAPSAAQPQPHARASAPSIHPSIHPSIQPSML